MWPIDNVDTNKDIVMCKAAMLQKQNTELISALKMCITEMAAERVKPNRIGVHAISLPFEDAYRFSVQVIDGVETEKL